MSHLVSVKATLLDSIHTANMYLSFPVFGTLYGLALAVFLQYQGQ